tara:strand:- start:33819 stop:34097 length:279 start_codon:yes stop_codon:yes gene_type:complete
MEGELGAGRLVCLGLGGGNKQSPHHHSPRKMDGTLEAWSHRLEPEVSRSITKGAETRGLDHSVDETRARCSASITSVRVRRMVPPEPALWRV